jgi:hypothetical protein
METYVIMTQHPPRDSAAEEILGFSFLRVFARDGVLHAGEIEMIERLALRDGVIDSKERAVLARIFDRIDPDRMDQDVQDSIRRFRERHGIR